MKLRAGRTLLILLLPIILVTSATYFHYNTLIEADFFCAGLKFEASDLEDLSYEKQNLWALKPLPSSQPLPDSGIFFRVASPSPIFSIFEPALSVLRC